MSILTSCVSQTITEAKARAQAIEIDAQAQAAATRLTAQAEADALRIKNDASVAITDSFAREMEFRRLEVARVGAYGNKTVFVGDGAAMASAAMAQGLALQRGTNLA